MKPGVKRAGRDLRSVRLRRSREPDCRPPARARDAARAARVSRRRFGMCAARAILAPVRLSGAAPAGQGGGEWRHGQEARERGGAPTDRIARRLSVPVGRIGARAERRSGDPARPCGAGAGGVGAGDVGVGGVGAGGRVRTNLRRTATDHRRRMREHTTAPPCAPSPRGAASRRPSRPCRMRVMAMAGIACAPPERCRAPAVPDRRRRRSHGRGHVRAKLAQHHAACRRRSCARSPAGWQARAGRLRASACRAVDVTVHRQPDHCPPDHRVVSPPACRRVSVTCAASARCAPADPDRAPNSCDGDKGRIF